MITVGMFSTLFVLAILMPFFLYAVVEGVIGEPPGEGYATMVPILYFGVGKTGIICAAGMLIFSILLIIFGFKKYTSQSNVQLSDHNKTIGLLANIIGIIEIIATLALTAIQFYFMSSPDFPNSSDVAMVTVLFAMGPLALGIMIFSFGLKVRKGPNDKVVILSELFKVFGIAGVIAGVCSIVLVIMQNSSGTYFARPLITLVASLIFVWASSKIASCNKNAVGKILWAAMLISILIFIALLSDELQVIFRIFILMDYALAGYIFAYGLVNLCVLYVHICIFVTLLLPEVRELMGVQKEQNTDP